VLLEAKAKAPKGKWLVWLDTHFVGSRRHAQRYMQLANNKQMLDATRVSHQTLRGAMREIRDSKALKEREERKERREEFALKQREYLRRVRAGEVRVPLEMQASHTYPFEEVPEGVENEPQPLLCLTETWMGFFTSSGPPDWHDEPRLWPLCAAYFLEEGDEEFLGRLHGWAWQEGRLREHLYRAVDLRESGLLEEAVWAGADEEESVFTPPTREISWEGSRLWLPTGHVEARLVGDAIWAWWVWDSVDGEEILSAADPEVVDTERLCIRRHLVRELLAEGRPPKWQDALQVEAALLADLEAVRAVLGTEKPDLTEPRVVYEIGERVLDEHDKHPRAWAGTWQRFAAYVASLNHS
jgi:hypothetical protein